MRKFSGKVRVMALISSSYSLASLLATPMKSQKRPVNFQDGTFSKKQRRQKERKGAMPVPVATQISTALGSSGSSSTLPAGPVIMISCPGLASHRKLEQMPFLAGSSLPISASQ